MAPDANRFPGTPLPAKSGRGFHTSQGEAMNDEGLDFGGMQIGEGRAFALGRESEPGRGQSMVSTSFPGCIADALSFQFIHDQVSPGQAEEVGIQTRNTKPGNAKKV